jgi:hypothetical protein
MLTLVTSEIKLSARTLALSPPDFEQPSKSSVRTQTTTSERRGEDMGSPWVRGLTSELISTIVGS